MAEGSFYQEEAMTVNPKLIIHEVSAPSLRTHTQQAHKLANRKWFSAVPIPFCHQP